MKEIIERIPRYIGVFMDRIAHAEIDEYDWTYICNSTDAQRAVKEYLAIIAEDEEVKDD